MMNWNKTEFLQDYIALIEEFKRIKNKPAIFICIPPPYYSDAVVHFSTISVPNPRNHSMSVRLKPTAFFGIQKEIVNYELPNAIAEISRRTNVRMIRVFDALGGAALTKPELLFRLKTPIKPPNDGCHPNDQGYAVIAQTIAAELIKYLAGQISSQSSLQIRTM